MVLLGLLWMTLLVSLFVAVGGKLDWLDFLYVASYIKLIVTVFKYLPQVRISRWVHMHNRVATLGVAI